MPDMEKHCGHIFEFACTCEETLRPILLNPGRTWGEGREGFSEVDVRMGGWMNG